MNKNGNDSDVAFLTRAETLEAIKNNGLEVENNLVNGQRLLGGKGLDKIAQMYPANIMAVYPNIGGIFDELILKLGPVPTPKAEFKMAAAPADEPSGPTPKPPTTTT